MSEAGEARLPVLQYYDEVDWLIEQGILFDAEQYRLTIDKDETGAEELVNEIPHLPSPESRGPDTASILQDYVARSVAFALRRELKVDALPILSTLPPAEISLQNKKTSVASIVLKNLPVPTEQTSWERIIEFRNDTDAFNKFLDLRNWMNEVAQGQMSVIECEQKLEYLISQYRRHMAIHELKAKTTTFQALIVSTAELLENLVKIQWGKLAKSLFAVRDEQIQLLQGELTSPGSEVAFIVAAHEQFGSR